MKGWDEKLSAFPQSIRIQVGNKCQWKSEGTCQNRRDALWTDRTCSNQTRHCQGMAHRYCPPGAGIKAHTRAGEPPLPRQDHGTTRQRNPYLGGPTSHLGQLDGLDITTNRRPPKDKHPCLPTLRVNFITKLLTPRTTRARTLLGGYQGCLLV